VALNYQKYLKFEDSHEKEIDAAYMKEMEEMAAQNLKNLKELAEDMSDIGDNLSDIQNIADKLREAAKKNYALSVTIKWWSHMKMVCSQFVCVFVFITIIVGFLLFVFLYWFPDMFDDGVQIQSGHFVPIQKSESTPIKPDARYLTKDTSHSTQSRSYPQKGYRLMHMHL